MGLTAFPNGISSFGIPVIGSGQIPVTTGSYFFVDSNTGVDDPSYGTYDKPFATVDYAVGKCTANKGDVIVLYPGHTETISAASGITCDVAGVSIVGLGNGSLRPTFTWSATASTWVVSAANVSITNILTKISIDEVVSMWTISGAGCKLDYVDFQPYGALGASGQAIQYVIVTGNYFTMTNCSHYQMTASAATQVWIDLNGVTGPKINFNHFYLTGRANTGSHLIGTTAACKDIEILGNRGVFLGATITGIVTCATGTTGFIMDNEIGGGAAVAAATAYVADGCYFCRNYSLDAVSSGMILSPADGTYT